MSLALALWVALVLVGAQGVPKHVAKPAQAPPLRAATRLTITRRLARRRCPRAATHTKPARRSKTRPGCGSATRKGVLSASASGRHSTQNGASTPNPAPASTPPRAGAPGSPGGGSANSAAQTSPPVRATSPTGSAGSPTPDPASAWDEPTLVDPTVITLSSTNYNLALPQDKDYILQCPNGPIDLPATLSVWGGHNVVIQDCDFEVNADWVAYLHNTAGTLWVDDVHFGGTNLTGGVQLQEPGATVVMRDVLFDTVYGSYATDHAELIQTWSGPSRFLVDGLTGSTTYQGLYLLPNQWYTGPAPTLWDFRNIDIDDSQGAYALWVSDQDGSFPLSLQNVYVVPNPARTWRGWWLWGFDGQDSNTAGVGTWAGVIAGAPASGHYVQAIPGGATGVDDGLSPAALAGEQP